MGIRRERKREGERKRKGYRKRVKDIDKYIYIEQTGRRKNKK